MAANITLSAGVRQNLLALQNTASLLGTTQNRLATGKKVNSALDNPTNFFTSSSLASRATDLSGILDQMSNGINTLKAADNGLTAITHTVESMQATINQARQDASWKGTSYTVDATAVGTASAKNLTFSGGTVGTTPVNIGLQTGSAGTKATLSTQVAYANITPAATSPVLTAATDFAPLDMTTGDETYSFDIVHAGGTTTVSLATGDNTGGGTTITLAEAIAGINTDLAATNVRARNNAGRLEFYMSNGATGAGQSITINNFVTGGTTPSALTLTGFASGNTQVGTNALTYSFTVSDGTTQKTISLDSTNAATLTSAVSTVNTQLGVGNSFEAFDNNGLLGLREVTATGKTLTIGGTDATTLFGAPLTNVGVAGTLTVKSVDQLVTDINADTNLVGKVKASNDNGKLNVQNLSTDDLTVVGAASTTINGGTGGGNTVTVGGNEVRKNLIAQFNDLRSQLDKLADDGSFNGVNLLHGDTLKLVFNETNTSSISIVSQNVNGINSSVLGVISATATEFSNNTSLDTRSTQLHDALTSLRSQSSAFGSNLSIVQNRQDFTKAMINTLQTGSDALVLADSNEEAANLLALQTRQQLSTTALSLASQSDQAVLRLF